MRVKTTSDKEHVQKIRDALKENDGYCPCAVSKNADTKCMCTDFREQIEAGTYGKCHCGLYEIVDE